MKIKEKVLKEVVENMDISEEEIIELTLAEVKKKIDDVDIELMFTDVKDKLGNKDELSDEIMKIIRIWWEGKSKELKKEIGI